MEKVHERVAKSQCRFAKTTPSTWHLGTESSVLAFCAMRGVGIGRGFHRLGHQSNLSRLLDRKRNRVIDKNESNGPFFSGFGPWEVLAASTIISCGGSVNVRAVAAAVPIHVLIFGKVQRCRRASLLPVPSSSTRGGERNAADR